MLACAKLGRSPTYVLDISRPVPSRLAFTCSVETAGLWSTPETLAARGGLLWLLISQRGSRSGPTWEAELA